MTEFDNAFDAMDDFMQIERKAEEARKAERSRQWREEATIHAYPYSKTEPMTVDDLKKLTNESTQEEIGQAWAEDHPRETRQWTKELDKKPAAPTPGDIAAKALSKSLDSMSVSTITAAKGLKKFSTKLAKASESISTVTHQIANKDHLHVRPFHTPEMIALRESLAKNQ